MKTIIDLKTELENLDPPGQIALWRWLNTHKEQQKSPKECFVIMPFSMTKDGRSEHYWTNFFEHFLKDSLRSCGYNVIRSSATPENIVKGIMEELAWSGLVLAVLTDSNVNVWYELGVRHSLQRGRTVLVCQQDQISALPFDLKQHGVAAYAPSLDQPCFIEEIKKHLSALNDEMNDSPVSEFLNSGLFYCINRSLAHRRIVMRGFQGPWRTDSDAVALKKVDQSSEAWSAQQIQVTIVSEDKILRHGGGVGAVPMGTDAKLCWQDMIVGNTSLYPQMKSQGKGLLLAAIKDCFGRLTAIAFDELPERNWLVVVEAHIKQGGL